MKTEEPGSAENDAVPVRDPAADTGRTAPIYRFAAFWSSGGLRVAVLKFAIFLAIPIVITIVLAFLAQAIISGH